MGNCVGGFKQRTRNIVWPNKRHSKELVIGFLGLDGSGKTTILKALQGEGAESVHPTMGFSRGEFAANRCKIVAYDLGGAERIRDIWKIYYAEIYAIVYVVDSAASSRIEENKRVVDALREHPDLMFKPILFLLNKKDLPEAMDEMAFSEHFALHTMACDNKTDIRVEGVCAVKGHGKDIDPMINEGIHWLIERVMARYEQLHKEIDLAEKRLKERQARERLERQHRLARLANHNSKDEPTEETVEMAEIPNGPSTSHQAAAPVANGVLRSAANHHEPPPPAPSTSDEPTIGSPSERASERIETAAEVERPPSSSLQSERPPTADQQSKEETIQTEEERVSTVEIVANKRADEDEEEPPHLVTIVSRAKSAGAAVARRRTSNKIVPEARVETPIRKPNGRVDYRLFEVEDGPSSAKRRFHQSPLRSKSYDRIFFQRARRPKLLTHHSGAPNSGSESEDAHSTAHPKDGRTSRLEDTWSN